MAIELNRNGSVSVGEVVIEGSWREVRTGMAYFEDPGVLCTDEMPIADLRQKLSEMFSAQSR